MTTPVSALHYHLPPERIAQEPLEPRDASRLLVCDQSTGTTAHHHVCDLPQLLPPGALLVLNETRVRPARVMAEKPTGGQVEVLLLRDLGEGRWQVQCSRRRRLHVGGRLVFFDGLLGATIEQMDAHGNDLLRVDDPVLFQALLPGWGVMPLPPYIHAPLRDPERYQTTFARAEETSAAAPTAGLHFTAELFAALAAAGIQRCQIELEVGLGTFEPVRVAVLEEHPIHAEVGRIPAETAALILAAKQEDRPVVAVGTTVVRLLEHAARQAGGFGPYEGSVETFITPGFRFQMVDILLTNFHLPGSTLLGLVAAFAGLEQTLGWYRLAVAAEYRFFSFGDAMLIR